MKPFLIGLFFKEEKIKRIGLIWRPKVLLVETIKGEFMIKDELSLQALMKLGFVRLSIFENETISKLKDLFEEHFNYRIGYLDSNVSHNKFNAEKSLKIFDQIKSIIKFELANHFVDFEVFSAHFAVKYKYEDSFVLHQDWNIVDESKTSTIQLWIPLSASYPENGGMCFIPESHKFMKNMRSGSLDITRFKIESNLYVFLSFARLLVGDAVAFYNNTIHGSFKNCDSEDRIAVVVNLKLQRDDARYFHQNELGQIEEYPLTTELLYRNIELLEKGNRPLWSKPIRTFNMDQRSNSLFSNRDLISTIIEYRNQHNLPLSYEFKSLKLLRNDGLEKEINVEGFAIIDFLDEFQISELTEVFENFFPNRNIFSGSFSSMSHLSGKKRREAHIQIQKIIKPSLDKLFQNYFSPISLLYSRRPDKIGKLHWHSDPSFILNEHLDPMYGIWCPLVNTNRIKGGLRLIRYGHRIVPKLNLTEENQKWPLSEHRKLLDKYAVDFKLKAGQALIYDTRMIHASDPNMSSQERDNIVMRVCHKRQKFMRFFSNSPNKVKLAELNEDYFFSEKAKEHLVPCSNICDKNDFHLHNLELDSNQVESFLKFGISLKKD